MFKDYNINQLVLPMNLETKLQDNDIAFHINELVESIPQKALLPFIREEGCPAYHPRMMLKIVLCGYSQHAFSGRRIEALLHDSLRMMWLAQGNFPSYRTINRFIVNPRVQELLRQCYASFRFHLLRKNLIKGEAIFIDGTKIEANANKFTFVWRKSTEKHHRKLMEDSKALYDKLHEEKVLPEIAKENEEELTINELETIASVLEDKIEECNEQISLTGNVQERKALRKRRKLLKDSRKLTEGYVTRKKKYEQQLATFDGRNSYSKTDTDATFMRMKEDHMKNGQLKAGYNVQVATEGQYVLACDVFPNPTDTKTLKPFLDNIESKYFKIPKYIVADAGYGSEENYTDILEGRNREALITYGMYRKEQTRKYKKDPFNTDNWEYDEATDSYTCPNGRQLTFNYVSRKTDKNGFSREFKVYECDDCTICPFREQCNKSKDGRNRTLRINERLERQKEYVRTKLSEEEAGSIYRQRKIDVEPVFGFLKANLRFTRFTVRGKEKVRNEIAVALMAVNMRKIASQSLKIG